MFAEPDDDLFSPKTKTTKVMNCNYYYFFFFVVVEILDIISFILEI